MPNNKVGVHAVHQIAAAARDALCDRPARQPRVVAARVHRGAAKAAEPLAEQQRRREYEHER